MKTLRIFVSSPGDVAEERQIAGRVIERLQGKYWSFVRLDDVFWETKVVRSTAHYQDELADPGECEIVIGILWSRLGSPLPPTFKKEDGGRWASGTEWELEKAFEAYETELKKTGDALVAKPSIVVYRRRQKRESRSDPKAEVEAANQEERLEQYLKEFYFFAEGGKRPTIKRPIISYHLREFEKKLSGDLEALILRQIPSLKRGYEPPPISGCPFMDLRAFDFEDSDRFFGRNREIRQLQDRLKRRALRNKAFILIYGSSGSGKSSLMCAGLAPVLTRPGGSLDEINSWRRVVFQPARAGSGPLVERLCRTLISKPIAKEAEESGVHKNGPSVGLPELTSEGSSTNYPPPAGGGNWDLGNLSRCLLSDDDRAFAIARIVECLESIYSHLLLQIDQLEELFSTVNASKADRASFFATLSELASSGRVWIVATMRSEMFPAIAKEPHLRSLVDDDGGFILQPPDRQALREIIRFPAMAARLNFERTTVERVVYEQDEKKETNQFDDLDQQILSEAETAPNSLPLLEFTLRQLYLVDVGTKGTAERRMLTWKSYCEMGGLKGAIADTADQAYRALPESSRNAAEYVIAALVRIDPGSQSVVRHPAKKSILIAEPGAKQLVDSFLAKNLLITHTADGETQPEIHLAHEALITHWPVMSKWVEKSENLSFLAARERFEDALQVYLTNGELLRDSRLAEAQALANNPFYHKTPEQITFLERSEKAAKKRLRFAIMAAGIFAAVAIAAIILGGLAKRQKEIVISKTKEAALKSRGRATEAFDVENDQSAGFAYLAESLEYDSENIETVTDAVNRLINLGPPHPLPVGNLLIHKGYVTNVEFGPLGKKLLTVSGDKTVGIWEVESGKIIFDIPLKQSADFAHFSPNGELIAIEGKKSVLIWDAITGKLLRELLGHTGPINSADFSSDVRYCVTSSDDSTAIIWDVTSGEIVSKCEGHSKNVTAAEFSPNGEFIVTGSADGTARLWKSDSGEDMMQFTHNEDLSEVTAAHFSINGKLIITAGRDSTMRVWDRENGKPLGKPMQHRDWISGGIDLSPDGQLMVSASDDGTARVWNIRSGEPVGNPIVHSKRSHSRAINRARFSSDGRLIVTASRDGTACVWNARTGERITPMIDHDGEIDQSQVLDCAFSPDGRRFATASKNRTAAVWNVVSTTPYGIPLRHGDGQSMSTVYDLDLSDDGKRIATAGDNNFVKQWDARNGLPLGPPLDHHDNVYSVNYSPTGKLIATCSKGEEGVKVRIWDTDTGGLIHEVSYIPSVPTASTAFALENKRDLYAIKFNPDENLILYRDGPNAFVVYDLLLGAASGSPVSFEAEVSSFIFGPEGRSILVALKNGEMVLLDALTKKTIRRSSTQNKALNDAKFGPNRNLVLTRARNRVDLWRASSLKAIKTSIEHEQKREIFSAEFSLDGSQIVTSSQDETARIWDASTSKLLGTLRMSEFLTGAKFSSDGNLIVTSSDDGSARGWSSRLFAPIGEPFWHDDTVSEAVFSQAGDSVVSSGKCGRIWPFERPEKVRGNWSKIVTNLTGCETNTNGEVSVTPVLRRCLWRERNLGSSNSELFEKRLTHWYCAAPFNRTVSPSSTVLISDLIEREIAWVFENAKISRWDLMKPEVAEAFKKVNQFFKNQGHTNNHKAVVEESYLLDPGHPLIHFGLAAVEDDMELAQFYRNFGLKNLPNDATICLIASRYLMKQSDFENAKLAVEKSLKLDPNSSEAKAALAEIESQ